MPKPRKGETKTAFVKRCIPQLIKKEGRVSEQAVAMCHSIWDREKGSK